MREKEQYKYFSIVFTNELDKWNAKDKKNTQEKFAELVDLASKNSITDYKKGYSFPESYTLKKIAEVLNVDVNIFTTPNIEYFLDMYNSIEAQPLVLETSVKVLTLGDKSEVIYPNGTSLEVDTQCVKDILKESGQYIEYLFEKLKR